MFRLLYNIFSLSSLHLSRLLCFLLVVVYMISNHHLLPMPSVKFVSIRSGLGQQLMVRLTQALCHFGNSFMNFLLYFSSSWEKTVCIRIFLLLFHFFFVFLWPFWFFCKLMWFIYFLPDQRHIDRILLFLFIFPSLFIHDKIAFGWLSWISNSNVNYDFEFQAYNISLKFKIMQISRGHWSLLQLCHYLSSYSSYSSLWLAPCWGLKA